jgi:hypothetical protein
MVYVDISCFMWAMSGLCDIGLLHLFKIVDQAGLLLSKVGWPGLD